MANTDPEAGTDGKIVTNGSQLSIALAFLKLANILYLMIYNHKY